MRMTDLQINGYAGVDFNSDDLTAGSLHAACLRLDADGVAQCLAAIITDALDRMCARLQRLVRLRAGDRLATRIIAGIHVEGPFLNPADGFRGAHPAAHLRPATLDAAGRLLDAGEGLVGIVTLAPECDRDHRVTRWLADRAVIVSAGHTDASLDVLHAAVDAGLSMFTHLGNGCPALLPRHDNIIQRALSLDGVWLSFIADGVHVPWPALGNYLRAAGLDRCVLVSDAVAPAGLGPGRYTLGDRVLDVGADLVVRAGEGPYLAGAGLGLPQAVVRLPAQLRLTDDQIIQLTCTNPSRILAGAGPPDRR